MGDVKNLKLVTQRMNNLDQHLSNIFKGWNMVTGKLLQCFSYTEQEYLIQYGKKDMYMFNNYR